jgi:hypothetical protein
MKQILAVIFILLISANIGSAQKSKNKKMLLGSWEMSAIEGKKVDKNDIIELHFKKDATLEIIEKGEKNISKWSLSNDGKSIIIDDADKNFTIKIDKIDKSCIHLDNDGDVAEFVRIKSKPVVKLKGLTNDLVGTWKEVNKSVMMLKFNADGTAFNSLKSETAQWKVSADGKQLLINVNDQEEAIDIDMAKDKKSFKMTVNGDIFTFVRSNEKFTQAKTEEVSVISIEEDKSNLKESEIIGNWKVTEIDKEILEGRSLMIELNSDKTFKVTENSVEERSGKWEFRGGRLYLIDIQSNNTDYSVEKDPEGSLFLKDYYGILKLKKQ